MIEQCLACLGTLSGRAARARSGGEGGATTTTAVRDSASDAATAAAPLCRVPGALLLFHQGLCLQGSKDEDWPLSADEGKDTRVEACGLCRPAVCQVEAGQEGGRGRHRQAQAAAAVSKTITLQCPDVGGWSTTWT